MGTEFYTILIEFSITMLTMTKFSFVLLAFLLVGTHACRCKMGYEVSGGTFSSSGRTSSIYKDMKLAMIAYKKHGASRIKYIGCQCDKGFIPTLADPFGEITNASKLTKEQLEKITANHAKLKANPELLTDDDVWSRTMQSS